MKEFVVIDIRNVEVDSFFLFKQLDKGRVQV